MNEPLGNVLTRDGVWVADRWHIVRDAAELDQVERDAQADAKGLVLPLAAYSARHYSAADGVWLAPTDDPMLLPGLHSVPLIAIDFPVFTDGRGYSIASTLRNRYRYDGELRAIGDVLIDQLFYLRRVGFSSFALRADQDRVRATSALRTFSDAYQGAADQPLPAFRRRARPSAHEAAR
jgi:uncharacterized protein (DUF934 family)